MPIAAPRARSMLPRSRAEYENRTGAGAHDADTSQTLTEEHELAEALALDGTDEALGVGVEVGTAGRQADRGDAGRGEEGPARNRDAGVREPKTICPGRKASGGVRWTSCLGAGERRSCRASTDRGVESVRGQTVAGASVSGSASGSVDASDGRSDPGRWGAGTQEAELELGGDRGLAEVAGGDAGAPALGEPQPQRRRKR